MEKEMTQKLINLFYWFHEHPELPYQECETTAKIKSILEESDIEILPASLETGLIAVIKGNKTGPVRALRADIDALPVTEETGLPYASKALGKMHACGHDFHIVCAIGCALLLEKEKDNLAGTVYVIFQPAEEESHGALKILETGIMDKISAIYGIHADPTNETGYIGIREGYVTAAVDKFLITLEGVSCHGAHPDDGIDPIPAAAALVQAFQTVISRNMNAFHPALLSVTRLEAGNTWNVIPQTAVLEGTVRTLDKSDRTLIEKRMREIVEGIGLAYGLKQDFCWIPGPPATYNDKAMATKVEVLGEECGFQIVEEEQSMGGDDFAYLEEKIPGCYIKIGTGKGPLIHQPGFMVDTSVIWPSVQFLVKLLLN